MRLYFFLVLYKVQANLRSDASRTNLNYFWWIIEPVLTMSVYYFVFAVLLIRGTPDFVLFLLCGLIPWLWFSKSLSNSMLSIYQARVLIQQVNIQKWFFPAVSVSQDLVKQSVVLFVFILFLLFYGVVPSQHWLGFIPVLFVEFLLIIAVSFFVAAIIPFIEDIRFIVTAGLQLLMFCSGVFFNLERIPKEMQEIFLLNPMAFLLHSSRQTLIWQQWPNWDHLLKITLFSLLLLLLALRILIRCNKIYPRIVN